MLNKYKDYIITLISVAATCGIILFVISPTLTLLLGEYDKLKSDQEELAVLTEKANKLASLNEAETRSLLSISTLALPSEKESFGIVSGLERLAATSGAKLDSFTWSPGVITTSSGVIKVDSDERTLGHFVVTSPFIVTMSGSQNAIYDFIDLAYRSLRIMGVETVSLGDGEMTIKMTTYYQKLKSNLGGVAVPLEDLTTADRQVIEKISKFPLVTTPPASGPVGKTNLFGP